MKETLNGKVSRRSAIKAGIGISGVFVAEGIRFSVANKLANYVNKQIILPASEQIGTWERVEVENDLFIEQNRSKLEKIKIGCSFSPEQYYSLLGTQSEEIKKQKGLKALEYIVQKINIKDIRLGLRWENVEKENGEIDLSFYKEYLDYCIENGVNICLNVGPIKTFGWPEEHISKNTLEEIENVPGKNSVIEVDSEIGQKALEHLENLLKALKKEYGFAFGKNIKVVQPDNEGFQPFGKYSWIMGEGYYKKAIQKITEYFPDVKILINSAGFFDIDRINSFLKTLDKDLLKYIIYGYDLYPRVGEMPKLFGKLDEIDSATFRKVIGRDVMPSDFKDMEMEMTEIQMKEWGRFIEDGNSVKHLKQTLLRAVDCVLKSQDKSIVRMFGIEEFVYKQIDEEGIKFKTDQHDLMADLIMKVNNLKPSLLARFLDFRSSRKNFKKTI